MPRSTVPTAREVRLAWLGAPADDGSDALAIAALDAVEHAGVLTEMLKSALAALREQHVEIARLRRRLAERHGERRIRRTAA